MAETGSEQAVVNERVGIVGEALQHLMIRIVSVLIAILRDEDAGAGFLRAGVGWVRGDGSVESGEGVVGFIGGDVGAGDAHFESAVVGIEAGGTSETRWIGHVTGGEVTNEVESAKKDEDGGDTDAKGVRAGRAAAEPASEFGAG